MSFGLTNQTIKMLLQLLVLLNLLLNILFLISFFLFRLSFINLLLKIQPVSLLYLSRSRTKHYIFINGKRKLFGYFSNRNGRQRKDHIRERKLKSP